MLLQEQKQRQSAALDNAITFNEALIEERDQGIVEISRQIGEVNEMFQVCMSDETPPCLNMLQHPNITPTYVIREAISDMFIL